MIAAADKGMAGECYILGNEEVTMRQLSDMIASETGCTPIKHFLPLPVAKGIAKIAEKTAGISGKKPVMIQPLPYIIWRETIRLTTVRRRKY